MRDRRNKLRIFLGVDEITLIEEQDGNHQKEPTAADVERQKKTKGNCQNIEETSGGPPLHQIKFKLNKLNGEERHLNLDGRFRESSSPGKILFETFSFIQCYGSPNFPLVVVSVEQITKVKIEDCGSYTNCSACLEARDPYCGWCSLEKR
ncbi:hypothetical protein RUM44_006359 [Polyplax serrata]|uniref:PSI domain-containing protein n=1 Tax=Polyplax serrata TaxID=468196 RepID=A0ABR1AHX0_POLSC